VSIKKSILAGIFVFLACITITFATDEVNSSQAEPVESETLYIDDSDVRNYKLSEFSWRPYRFKPNLFGMRYVAYAQALPEKLAVDLQYNEYPMARHFGVALNEGVYIRQTPSFSSKIISKRSVNTKLNILAKVHGEYMAKWKSDYWYEVEYSEKGSLVKGYVFSGYLEKREFQYKKMLESVQELALSLNTKQTGHVSNYKNKNGRPPLFKGLDKDNFGYSRDQSAPGYTLADASSPFRYLSDGRLLLIEGEVGDFYACTHPSFEGRVFIPKKYIVLHDPQKLYSKFIVVDRKNQTEAAFEKRQEGWFLVSQNLVTTGATAEFKEATELGHFSVIEKRAKFIYLDDVTKEVDGYAPYALRFNGGAYTHGVPVNFTKIKERILKTPEVRDALGVLLKPAVYEERVKELVDPGMVEYLSTIGTIPRSHKCVRHHTSNALFLYNWAVIGETAMIVIE